jgi:hypothetical protein
MISQDLYNIADKIHNLDKRFTVNRNAMDGSYTIYQNGYFFQNVPHDEFDERILKHIEKTIWINTHGDILKDIDENNAKIEKAAEDKVADIEREMKKDIKRVMKKKKGV